MNLKRKYILLIAAAAICVMASAQNLNSAYFTEDYKFRHDMNPAFANEQNYVSVPMLGNVNVSLHGNFGYQDVVMNNPLYPSQSAKSMTTFMNPYISVEDALSGFNKGDNRLQGNVSLTLLSAGFKAWGGYNTLSISSKTSFGMVLPYELFEFAKNIGNNTYNIGDMDVNAMSYVELALGHSRNINEKLRVGAKMKMLIGAARADVAFKDVKADLAGKNQWVMSGKATANMSMKGFVYKSEASDYKEPGKGTYQHVNDIDIDGAGIGGLGFAVDLGAVYKINDDFCVSASVLDLGFINWSNDMLAENQSETFVFNGFHDVSVTSSRGEEMEVKADRYSDQLADFANLKDMGDQGARTTGLGATINLGCEYTLPVYRKLSFGALASSHINGDYSWTEGRVSANWKPLKWLDGGVNFAVNNFTASMGWILNIHPKGYNFFVGMDHLLGKTSKELIPLSSNANIVLGMNIAW